MTSLGVLTSEIDLDEERDRYEMAHFFPRETGLPMTVWISPKRDADHDVQLKVCMLPGDRLNTDRTATVTVRPAPRLLHGKLSSPDLAAVKAWVGLNAEVLIDYWNGRASTLEMARRLRPL